MSHQLESSRTAKVINLMSDTVTRPDVRMRQAMFDAEVGDDGYGEDPTVNLLEKKASTLLGKEAALFLPSGIMGNLISPTSNFPLPSSSKMNCYRTIPTSGSTDTLNGMLPENFQELLRHNGCIFHFDPVMAHTKSERGCEVIVGDKSHILLCEQSGAAQIAGLQMREVRNMPDGTLDMAELRAKLRPTNPLDYESHTLLVCIENTLNYLGGVVLPLEWLDQLGDFVKEKNLLLHMDGARVFNAAVHLGVPVSRIVEHCDSVTFCLSKGLGAPVGAVLVGNKSFIERARRIRKVLGGAMRQAGVVAAAGVYALDNCVERLADDHRRTKRIGYAIQQLASPDVTVNSEKIDSNILIVTLNSSKITPAQFYDMMLKVNDGDDFGSAAVRISYVYDGCVRLVLHKDITDEDVDATIEKIGHVVRKIDCFSSK